MAAYYMEKGRYPEALPLLEKAIIIEPEATDALMMLADVETRLGRNKEAEQHLRQAYAADAGDPRVNASLGKLVAASGRCREAAPYLEVARELRGPRGIDAMLAIADCQFESGQSKTASETLLAAGARADLYGTPEQRQRIQTRQRSAR
jgi:Tfp pilus assembly protein PilF